MRSNENVKNSIFQNLDILKVCPGWGANPQSVFLVVRNPFLNKL
jgi:hypothetical protein